MTTWPNWLDLIIVTIVLRGCYRGYSRGVLTELLSLVGAVSVTALTVNYGEVIAHRLLQWFQFDPTVATFLLFWLIFLSAALAVRFVLKHITELIAWERLHWVGQMIGLVLGAARGFWWSAVIVVALSSAGIEQLKGSVESSLLGAPYSEMAHRMLEEASSYVPGASARRDNALFPPARKSPKAHPGRDADGA